MKKIYSLALLLVCALCGSMSGQSLSEKSPEYILECGDVLELHYRYTPEFDQEVTIRPDNRAAILNIGTILTSGMTVSQFKEKVVELSRKTLVDPEITIVLKDFDKPHVFVEGEVNNPGKVNFRSNISVLDAIALAGGFKTSGAKSNVILLHRTADGTKVKATALNLKKMINPQRIDEVVMVRSNDVIYVTQDKLSKVERITHLGQFGAIYNPFF